MLGWEFPPYFVGGVGTVCYELTKALSKRGIHVTYVMPHGPDNVTGDHVKLLVADREAKRLGISTFRVKSLLTPYVSEQEYAWNKQHLTTVLGNATNGGPIYGNNLLEEVERFAHAVLAVADDEQFDVIHAHDWTTIPAALALGKKTGKPVILHVHITEFDKTGGEHADPRIYRIEHEGFHKADIVIAISNFVKRRLMEKYFVPEHKIRIVYNSVDFDSRQLSIVRERLNPEERIVLFLGRVTLQKGPDYFLEAAAKVAPILPNVRFVIAGTGDMLPRMIEHAAHLGIGNRVTFTGFVNREDGDRLYRMADLFVMPSVSEPFGLVPLEAMRQGTPVIVSRQSGVSEIIKHALKVDFWDTDDLASKMIAALSYSELHSALREHGVREISVLTWDTPAQQCVGVYEESLRARGVAW